MSDSDNIIVDTTLRIFGDLGDPQMLNSRRDEGWREPLWKACEDSGLTLAWVSEDFGGAGATLGDGFDILRCAGSFAVAIPIAETLLAGWLLSRASLSSPRGPMSVAPARAGDGFRIDSRGRISGSAGEIPFARDAAHLALVARGEAGVFIALVKSELCAIEPATNIASEPRDVVSLEQVTPDAIAPAPAGLDEDALVSMGAAIRAVQISGALQAILDRSVAYAKERVAFGRPISGFQAVQHALARLAGDVAAALAASGSAADAIESADCPDVALLLEIAAAKIRAGEAAGSGSAIAHQVHGAIGYSMEHVLQRYTQRLRAWRDDFGSESVWAERLGRAVAARGADALWPLLATR